MDVAHLDIVVFLS